MSNNILLSLSIAFTYQFYFYQLIFLIYKILFINCWELDFLYCIFK